MSVIGPGNVQEISITRDALETRPASTVVLASSWTTPTGLDGRLATATDALGHVRHFGYNASGNLTTFEDDASLVTTMTYDASNRLLSQKDPAGGVTAYAYDSDGNLTQVTDPKNHVWVYTYDEQQRLLWSGSTRQDADLHIRRRGTSRQPEGQAWPDDHVRLRPGRPSDDGPLAGRNDDRLRSRWSRSADPCRERRRDGRPHL